MKLKNENYLGDGVYVGTEDRSVVLYTSNGRDVTNTVYLDLQVLAAFLRYLDNLNKLTSSPL